MSCEPHPTPAHVINVLEMMWALVCVCGPPLPRLGECPRVLGMQSPPDS